MNWIDKKIQKYCYKRLDEIRAEVIKEEKENNGWIKVFDIKDLPDDSEIDFDRQPKYRSGRFTSDGTFCLHLKETNWFALKKAYTERLVTHYQLIEKLKLPLH